MSGRWRRRGQVALLGVSLALVLFPLAPQADVIDSDWTAFATGARLIVSDPSHLYDLAVQRRVQSEVTHGRVLVSPGIEGILPFLAPAWVALLAVPFEALGTDLGGRLWILFGLACLLAGLYLAIRPRPPSEILPAFASVPVALLMLNAQLDGIVALGLGAAIALVERPYLSGLALGLTLVKPQLVLPLGVAVVLSRRWKVLAGWAAAGLVLLAATLAISPGWPFEWLGQVRATVAPVSREVDLAHFGTLVSGPAQIYLVAALALAALGYCVWIASRCRGDLRAAVAVLVAGGVLVSPHALPADLVLVCVGLALWGRATWLEWLAVSVAALAAALIPPPVPAAIGVLLVVWLTARISLWRSPAPAPASPR